MFVSNTSTLILLAKVECLEKFIEVSPLIIIPSQVKEEAMFKKGSYEARLIHQYIEKGKIRVIDVEKKKVEEVMDNFRLDEGEAAAYVMFESKKHNALLTDDGELIKLCKLKGIFFICAMAIILRLYEKEILSKKETLSKLEELNKVGRYSKEIYEYFKMEVK